MRYSPPRRETFADRRPPRGPQQVRADWVAGIMLAGALAGQVVRDGEPDADFRRQLTRLSLSLRDLKAENFPVPAPSARIMAAAFLALARNFAHPAWSPQARTACAPFLLAGASCVDGLLDGLRVAEAVSGRRVLGERDEP